MSIKDYAERQKARKERYEELAKKHQAAYEQRSKAAADSVSEIPFGQPILVGHHSERHHRAALKRHDTNIRKAIEEKETVAYYAERAAGVGKAGVSSDDPEAVTKLLSKLDDAQHKQEQYKAINKAVKMNDVLAGDLKLAELGFSPKMIAELRTPDFMGRIGIPTYVLQNNSANMARMKKRIAELQIAPTVTQTVKIGEVEIVENAEENRIQIVFPSKPEADIRSILKSYGFRWSPTNMAWQRHLNNAGRYAAQEVANKISESELK